MRLTKPGLLAFAAGGLLVGCGSGEREPTSTVPEGEREVMETIDSLHVASRRGDGKRVCDELFTQALVKSIEAAARTRCSREVRRGLFSPETELAVGRDIRVNDGRAIATVMEQGGQVSTLFLVNQGGRWRIDRVRPRSRGEG